MRRENETAIGRIGRRMLALVYPPLCLVCGREVETSGSLCPDCWGAVQFLDGAVCRRCGAPFAVDPGGEMECAACLAAPPAFAAARAVMRYDEASKAPILALKHADRLELAPPFADWMIRAGRTLIAESEVVVPVPLHWRRLWSRRYNQSGELGRWLAQKNGLAFAPQALHRLRPTPSQGDMPSAAARRRNVRGAFAVAAAHRAEIAGKTVLLIDDVMTTGATVDACARALQRAGAQKVFVLALARVVRPAADTI